MPADERCSYIGLVRLSDQTVLASVFSTSALSSQKAQIERAFLSILQKKKPFDNRYRESFPVDNLSGQLFLQVDYNFAFGLWIKNKPSESFTWDFIRNLVKETKDHGEAMNSESSLALNKELKKPYRLMMDEFNSDKDAIGDIQIKAEQVNIQMADNMKTIVGNVGEAENLEEKSKDLHDSSNQFQSKATAFKRKSIWENIKVKGTMIVVVLITLTVILYATVPADWYTPAATTETTATTVSTETTTTSVAGMTTSMEVAEDLDSVENIPVEEEEPVNEEAVIEEPPEEDPVVNDEENPDDAEEDDSDEGRKLSRALRAPVMSPH